jgi:hypothetical protein
MIEVLGMFMEELEDFQEREGFMKGLNYRSQEPSH